MKGLIVDHDTQASAALKKCCLEYCEGLEIIGEVPSIKEAKNLIDQHQPELVFLTVQLPEENGFSLLNDYKTHPPFSIIFITKSETHALKAFKHSAVDYLLKPIDENLLQAAYEKVKRRRHVSTTEKMQLLKEGFAKQPLDKLALPILDGYLFVKINEIIRCEAKGNYTQVHLINKKSLLITKTLKHYEDLLTNRGFFRIQKSHLVNLQHIRRFLKIKNNKVEMIDGVSIEVSPLKKDALQERMQARKNQLSG